MTQLPSEFTDTLEAHMLPLPQAECPVVHHFGPGIYIREVHLPAGVLALGHSQKYEHLNIMLKGSVVMIKGGKTEVLSAPAIFVGSPGRKFGYVLEDTVWQNVYATTETDIDILEATYLDKSQGFQDYEATNLVLLESQSQVDREDFAQLLLDLDLTDDNVRAQSEETSDRIDLPSTLFPKVSVRSSTIQGRGVFANYPIEKDEVIGPARVNGLRTILGCYTNHSKTPNAKFVVDDGNIYLCAVDDIPGCIAGLPGTEITVDYRQALKINKELGELKCQE